MKVQSKKEISVPKIIKTTIDLIFKEKNKQDIKAILLFGSHANKTAIKRSDIDICVIFKKDVTLQEATKFRINLSGKLPDIVDIQVFNVLSVKIKKSIVDNHKIIFQSKDFDEFNFNLINQKLFFENRRKMAALEV